MTSLSAVFSAPGSPVCSAARSATADVTRAQTNLQTLNRNREAIVSMLRDVMQSNESINGSARTIREKLEAAQRAAMQR